MQVKKQTIIFDSEEDWLRVRQRIIDQYGLNVVLISWKLKRDLGFTVRRHKAYLPWEKDQKELWGHTADLRHQYYPVNQVHLDFYNDSSLSFFILKFLENQ
jgi:hypothetical protein